MNRCPNWQIVYNYFRGQGVPKKVLDLFCIGPPEAKQISTIIEKAQPQTILEIGTFIGLSTGVIALTRIPGSALVCIDPDLPVDMLTAKLNYHEHRRSLTFVRQMLAHFGQEQKTYILQGYFSHLSARKREQIILMGDDPEHATIIGEKVGEYAPYDLVFLDGDHYADAVYSDLSLMAPFLSKHGIIVLHDVSYDWGEQVRAGIEQFVREHPDWLLSIDHNLGFLCRDEKRAWLVRQRPEIMSRVRQKAATLLSKF